MTVANMFGQIVTASQVEHAVVATLNMWMDEYLEEIERVDGRPSDSIQRPLGIITASQFEKWPEDQIPCIVVINAGLNGQPVRRSQGRYDAEWLVGISPIVSDVNVGASRDLALTYAAAVRVLIGQHKKLASPLYPSGFAQFSMWHGEQYTDMPFQNTRSLAAAQTMFSIGVESVFTEQAGPRVPNLDPDNDPGPWPTVIETYESGQPVTLTGAIP